jgi:hypothetical protein
MRILAVLVASVSFAAGCDILRGNASGVVVLMDYSATFAPYRAEDEALLREIGSGVASMIVDRSLPQPVKIVWAAFGSVGLQPLQPCGPPRTFRQTFTRRLDTRDEINSRESLTRWFAACHASVMATSHKTEQYTDVSGALAFAADAVQDVLQERVIVLFSDLREDLPAGQSVAEVNLRGSRVLLIWRPGLDDRDDPNVVSRRAQEWRARLLKTGATIVCARASQAITAADMTRCLAKTN